ncbi:kelch-like protein 38 [Antedon mediterranea]|uniref:kelch-like protein 38 n=1 Tax=Antedon mediterranea TaxID=105859 RepID=UPI003AF7B130
MAESSSLKPADDKQLKAETCSQPHDILCSLDNMRKRGDLTDTIIHIHKRTFHAHRAILACSSEYFRAMFTSNLSESINGIVHFNNQIDPHIFSLLLDYSYTTELTVTDSNAQALLETACHLQYNKVIDACCNFLIQNLDPPNCLGIQKFSERLSLWNLYKKAQQYALDYFLEVVKHDEYHQLTLQELRQYLSNDEINIDREESIYKAIFAWIRSNDNQELLPSLLSCVRLPFTRPDFLLEQLDNPLIKQNPECAHMLRSARNNQLRLREKYLCDSTLIPRYSTKSEVVVVMGGSCSHDRDVFYYNPSTDRWGILTRLPNLDIFDFAVGTLDNCIYISGGIKSKIVSNEVYCYDVDKAKWHSCKNFHMPRTQHSSIGINGFLYIIGDNRMVDMVERFSPAENLWEVVSPLPVAVSSPVIVSNKHKIYVTGGSACSQLNQFQNIQCYDTINDTWTVIRTVSIPRKRFPVIVIDDIMYILSGYGEMQVYDIKSDSLLPPMLLPNKEQNLFGAVAVRDKIYAAIINKHKQRQCDLQLFDPRIKEWQKKTTMPSAVGVDGHCLSIYKYLGPPFSSK